jgi:hypothetical protein
MSAAAIARSKLPTMISDPVLVSLVQIAPR